MAILLEEINAMISPALSMEAILTIFWVKLFLSAIIIKYRESYLFDPLLSAKLLYDIFSNYKYYHMCNKINFVN